MDAETFTCGKCKKTRLLSFKSKTKDRKAICRICDSHRPHNGDFEKYEAAFLYRLRMREHGLKDCARCNKTFKREEIKKNSYCPDCAKEVKYEARKRSAAKQGRIIIRYGKARYVNAQWFKSHVEAYRKHAAKKAEITAKPWTDPSLTDAEKYRMQYRLDAEFQLKERLRRQINKKLKRDDVADLARAALSRKGQSKKAESMLGYKLADLRLYLERQFTKGMTWERFMAGEIHIDHIVPQKAFNLSDDDEWRRCWCLTNLRPMWAVDNWKKSAKVEYLL